MPIVKIYRKGEPNEELIVDHPDQRAPARARDGRLPRPGRGGEDRRAALPRDGPQVRPRRRARTASRRSWTRARRWRAPASRDMPDGVYEAESFMDDDGINVGQRVPIRCGSTIAGDRMTVDLTDVVAAGAGLLQLRRDRGRSCCQVAFKCLTSPLDLPINDGQFRALDIVLPPGRVVSAVKPAAMRMWMTYPMTIVDTIFKALAPALPDQVIAGHHADLVRRPHQRPPAEGQQLLHLSRRADRRRLGRQARQRRHERRDRHERRRHPQRPVRAGRGEVSAAGRALLPAAGFRRRRHATAAGSAPSRWCRRAIRSASRRRWTA